jgi:hypothetical protein
MLYWILSYVILKSVIISNTYSLGDRVGYGAPNLVVKIKRTSPEHPQQFQGVLRLAEDSKRVILSTLMFAVSSCRREYSFARGRAFQIDRR